MWATEDPAVGSSPWPCCGLGHGGFTLWPHRTPVEVSHPFRGELSVGMPAVLTRGLGASLAQCPAAPRHPPHAAGCVVQTETREPVGGD